MKHFVTYASLLCLVAMVGCGGTQQSHEDDADAVEAVARIEPKSGSEMTGTARFSYKNDQVIMRLELANVEPGDHAFHLHEVGDCSAADGTSAGGHWNPTAEDHGKWGKRPFHLGDVGNIKVGPDGAGRLMLTTPSWSIGTGGENDIVGKAVIVHAGVDDYTTQPTGAAGGRIGCGVVESL